jgi:hypothetical protein
MKKLEHQVMARTIENSQVLDSKFFEKTWFFEMVWSVFLGGFHIKGTIRVYPFLYQILVVSLWILLPQIRIAAKSFVLKFRRD